MKSEWSSSWKSSKQPRKQRKYRYNASLHIRRKMVSSVLSKELRKRAGKRSMPVRKGDTVQVMRGDFKGVTGKVEKVSLKKLKIYIDAVKAKKTNGQEVMRPVDPSNVMIISVAEEEKRLKVSE